VAFASRQVWQKGFDIFNKVAEKVDCKVKVSGNIPEDEMPEFLSDAHTILTPARSETFGLTLVEANLCETPVVASPLASHMILGLPLRYASTINDYLYEINYLKEYFDIQTLRGMCRESALKYDKKYVIGKLEKMLCKVANES
jgi:glycosyltransferase involved in cell wall biosynthesis